MRVEGYTKQDGTVVESYERLGSKKVDSIQQSHTAPRRETPSRYSNERKEVLEKKVSEASKVRELHRERWMKLRYTEKRAPDDLELRKSASDLNKALDVVDSLRVEIHTIESAQAVFEKTNSVARLPKVEIEGDLDVDQEYAQRLIAAYATRFGTDETEPLANRWRFVCKEKRSYGSQVTYTFEILPINDPVPVEGEILPEVPAREGYVYRGMSQEEWELIKKRGYVESLGLLNLGQEGLTFYGEADTASYYAGGFAPFSYAPTTGIRNVVIEIPKHLVMDSSDRSDIPASEFAHLGKVSIGEISTAYELIPEFNKRGIVEIIVDGYEGRVIREGSRFSPAVTTKGYVRTEVPPSAKAKSMIRKARVAGYTKKDGTVVQGYERAGIKARDEWKSGSGQRRPKYVNYTFNNPAYDAAEKEFFKIPANFRTQITEMFLAGGEQQRTVIESCSQEGIDASLVARYIRLGQLQSQENADRAKWKEAGPEWRPDDPSSSSSNAQIHSPKFKDWFGQSKIVNEDGSPRRLFHGSRQVFETFDLPKEGLINQLIGVHFAKDPSQTEAFSVGAYARSDAWSAGDDAVRRREGALSEDLRGSELIQTGGNTTASFVRMNKPFVVPSAGGSDQHSIAVHAYSTVYREHKDMFIWKNAAVDPTSSSFSDEQLSEAYDLLKSGKSTSHLPRGLQVSQSSIDKQGGDGLAAFCANRSQEFEHRTTEGQPWSIGKETRWANQVADAYREIMESQGYDGLIYENTSSNEVGLSGEIDHTAYIVFRPEQIKSAVGNNGDFDPNNPNPTKSMIRKGMVAGGLMKSQVWVKPYTKGDGTKVEGYYKQGGSGGDAPKVQARFGFDDRKDASLPSGLAGIRQEISEMQEAFDSLPARERAMDGVGLAQRGKGLGAEWKKAIDKLKAEEKELESLFYKNQTDTEAFRAWFGESEVVNEDGSPMVVYHSTDSDLFDKFEHDRPAYVSVLFSSVEVEREGFFFTQDRDASSQYGKNVMPFFLKAENIADMTGNTEEIEEAWHEAGNSTRWFHNVGDWEKFDEEDGKLWVEFLKSQGYDAAKIWDETPEGDEFASYVVFGNDQIKSADRNEGAFNPYDESNVKSMIRKGMVAGYTKKDGTVVKPYQTSRTKKADDALAPKNISSEWIKLTKLLNKFNDDGQHDLYDEMNAAKESFEQAVNDEAKQGQGESNKDYLARLTKKHDRLKSSHRNSEELRRQFPSRIHQLEKSNILLRARNTLGRARDVAKTKVEKEQIGIAPVLQSAKKLEEASAQNRGSHVLGRMNRDLRDEVMKAASTRKDESYEMFHARIARCRVFVSKEMNDASNTHQNILSAIDRQLTAANYRKQVTAKVVGQVGLHAKVGNPDPNSIIESQYYDGQKERSVEQFGLTPSEIAKLAGTTASADVEISYDGNEIGIKSEDGFSSERIIMKDRGGDPYIYNSWFSVNVKGEGLGSTILARQVQNAINHGFAKIKCSAARGNAMTGYYVWPLLGYDGPVPDKFSNPDRFRGPSRAEFEEEFKNLPENLKNATMVSEFFKTQEGMEFWKKWGLTFDATFDLSEGSYSRRWFAHRIERKENVAA